MRYHGTNCNSRSRVGPGELLIRWLLFEGGRDTDFEKMSRNTHFLHFFSFLRFRSGCWWRHIFSYFDKLSYFPDHTCHYFVFKIHKLYKILWRGGWVSVIAGYRVIIVAVASYHRDTIVTYLCSWKMLRRVQFWKEVYRGGKGIHYTCQNYVQHRGSPTKTML